MTLHPYDRQAAVDYAHRWAYHRNPDYYDFDEKNYCLIGRRHGVRYTLGDRVKVQVARADLDRKQLDFALIDDKGNPNKPIEVRNPGKRHEPQKHGKGKSRGRGGNRRR